jgi:signal transduction histidine kinase
MKRRLLWSYLSITALVLVVLVIPLGVSYANSVERRLTSDIQHDAFALAIRTQAPLDSAATDPASVERLEALTREYHASAGGRVLIVDAQGRAIADSDRTTDGHASEGPAGVGTGRDFSNRAEIASALDGSQVSGIRSSRTLGEDLLYVALPIGSAEGIQGAVRITYPASVVGDRIREMWLLLAATAGVVLGIVFLASLLLARSMTRPLGELRSAAGRLGAGDLAVRAEVPKGPAELTELAESFNTTAARLEQLVNAQRGFVADASHQLRTPLAALRLRLEILEADVDGAVADDLDGALAEVERLSRLVDALLALARTEHAVSEPVPVSLAAIVGGRCDAWDAFAAERHVRIESSIVGAPYARATPGRLEQVVDNLLNNALEVAPADSVVRLEASSRGGIARIVVSDQGPGMSADERARAFDRFWQSSVARREGRPNGHFGLGLAIVRELVVGDGGDIILRSVQPHGLEVSVELRPAVMPRAAAAPPTPGAKQGRSEPARQLSTTSG